MKKALLLFALLLAFAWTASAQDQSATSSQTTTTAKKSHKSASSKGSTLTGCVSQSANSEGNYTLTNGRHKKGVELLNGTGDADISKHAGHEVRLTGNWTTAEAEGAGEANKKEEKGERHFQVTSIKHISDTCTAMAGSHKSKKATSSEGMTPKS
jgi:opacity protein-like surface antigen